MKRKILSCLLLSALLCGCGKGEAPPAETPATYDEPTISQVETTTVTTEPIPETTTAPITTEPTTEAATTIPTTTAVAVVPTLPLPTTAPTITPPIPEAAVCSHSYQPGIYQAPTCTQAGYQNYQCSKCGSVYQQVSAPLAHSYENATCISAKRCVLCGSTQGSSLGHSFSGGICSRCGEKDPDQRTITIQVKDTKNKPVDGVTVALYIADQLHSTAVSSGGKVSFTVMNHSGSYTVALTGIPAGYEPQKNSYTYSADNGTVVLEILAVVTPEDHSKAAYKVGSTMGEFTVTDVDGKTHQLSQILKEKKLVILNFWYYTCIPCKAEFPYFNAVYEKYSDDIEILGLNHFDSESKIKDLRSEMNLCFPLATEHLGMQQGFNIQSYPVSVFIDRTGRIIKIQKDIGFQSEAELETIVRQMIGL